MEQPGFLLCSSANTLKSCQITQIVVVFFLESESREKQEGRPVETKCVNTGQKSWWSKELTEADGSISGSDFSIFQPGPCFLWRWSLRGPDIAGNSVGIPQTCSMEAAKVSK